MMDRTRRLSRSSNPTASERSNLSRTRRWGCQALSAPTRFYQHRSSSTPMVTKCGATSAISTGRVRKRLSCCRKRLPARNKAEQPPVDRRKPERNQREPGKILWRERLAEEKSTEEDRDGRHEQGDKQCVGRARRGDQAEVEHVAECRAQ